MFQSTASIIEEIKEKAMSDLQTGKEFDTSMHEPSSLEWRDLLPSSCRYSAVQSAASPEDATKFQNLVDGVNEACHYQVPLHDLRAEKILKD